MVAINQGGFQKKVLYSACLCNHFKHTNAESPRFIFKKAIFILWHYPVLNSEAVSGQSLRFLPHSLFSIFCLHCSETSGIGKLSKVVCCSDDNYLLASTELWLLPLYCNYLTCSVNIIFWKMHFYAFSLAWLFIWKVLCSSCSRIIQHTKMRLLKVGLV